MRKQLQKSIDGLDERGNTWYTLRNSPAAEPTQRRYR